MFIKELQLRHFRNYEKLAVNLNKKINVFVGNNAQGKTNILEAICVLAITKSHRMNLDANLIQKDSEYSKIKGIIKKVSQTADDELEILLNCKGKQVSINKKPAKKISDYISYFNVIIFHPDNLDILKGSPSERRKFLNIEIGQMDNRLLVALNNYNSLLRNRNEYLKRVNIDNYDKNYLGILTDQLINNAVKIYNYREKFINDINIAIKHVNEKIGGFEDIEIKYETSIPLGNQDDTKNALLKKYNATLQREIFMAQTMIGPHRDDFVFLANGKNVKDYGSQGQQRMAVLCLKLAEIELFKKVKGEYPVLLLDDVFSELDNNKKHKIIKYLNKKMQIMITTTDISDIDKTILEKATIFRVDKAKITEISG